MPRKPKQEKQTLTVIVNGLPVAVILHPPIGSRKSWYAYWNGLITSKSTGQRKLDDAIVVAENMVRSWKSGQSGQRTLLGDLMLSDEEFDKIQQVHFSKHQEPAARLRASKTHKVYLEASTAFRVISELRPITAATADDCAKFQRDALERPKNWRQQHPKSKLASACVSPNTVLKWSRSLQAAFERANRNAGRKCVRGVVSESKLLVENPWNRFTWIGGRQHPIRQFDSEELVAFLDYLSKEWPGVTVGPALAKTFLWSRCRLDALTRLEWQAYRPFGTEHHFHVVEKRGVEWWFRIPDLLLKELMQLKGESPFVFAAYNDQLRQFHAAIARPDKAMMVAAEFNPRCLGDWFYDRMTDWSASSSKGHAHPHVFRKTSLQLAWNGEDCKRQVITDARVGESVLKMHYLLPTDKERREESNRNFHRIAAGLPPAVARRYGHVETSTVDLESRLKKAISAKDWTAASQVSAELANQNEVAAL